MLSPLILLSSSSVNFLYIRHNSRQKSNWNELLGTAPIKQIHRQAGLNLTSLEYPICMITTVSCVLVPCILQCKQSYGVYALTNDLLLNTHVQLFSYPVFFFLCFFINDLSFIPLCSVVFSDSLHITKQWDQIKTILYPPLFLKHNSTLKYSP